MKLSVKTIAVVSVNCFVLFQMSLNAAPRLKQTQTQYSFPNIQVVDQTGKSLKFYDDLVKDRIVAINFVFTRCTMTCPIAGFQFGQLRRLLGDRAGKDILLISVTMDAVYDTPVRLQTWAAKFNAGEGWTQITGEKQKLDQLLKSLYAFSVDKQDHSTLILIANDKLKRRKWINGNSEPQRIFTELTEWAVTTGNESQAQN